jgi:hypothetical protein
VPWTLQFNFYFLLYRAFPKDRDGAAELERLRRLRPSPSQSSMLDASAEALSSTAAKRPTPPTARPSGELTKRSLEGTPPV